MTGKPIRVLVAEDSPTSRALLVALLASDPEFQVVGEAADGRRALELAKRLRPDIITMDVRMPYMDGLEATRCIMIAVPTPIVVVSATLDEEDVSASMRAIRAGALTALAKPPGPDSPDFEAARVRFLATVKALSAVKVVGHRLNTGTRPLPPAPPASSDEARPFNIVALAASTGGPGALRSIFDTLPSNFPVPIVVVQHLSPGFLPGFVHWLASTSRLRVKLAGDGEVLRAGTVYFGLEDHHLAVSARGTARALSEPPVEGFRPSASVLFESVAEAYGAGALAGILTGMGHDGIDGLRRLHSRGGRIIAQDEQSCSVFGMPAAAIGEGIADFVLPIAQVPAKLVELVGRGTK